MAVNKAEAAVVAAPQEQDGALAVADSIFPEIAALSGQLDELEIRLSPVLGPELACADFSSISEDSSLAHTLSRQRTLIAECTMRVSTIVDRLRV